MDDVCYEWEKRTGMGLSCDVISEIYQKDVNNYIFTFADKDEYECKGAYVKENNPLDNDLPIVNEAIRNYLLKSIPIEKTITSCNDLIKFQKIVRIKGNYTNAVHNGKKLSEKTFRVFASKDVNDSYIGKQKGEGATVEKFANTPEHCFIDNSDVTNKQVNDLLNKNWYIDLANKRLKEFGVE